MDKLPTIAEWIKNKPYSDEDIMVLLHWCYDCFRTTEIIRLPAKEMGEFRARREWPTCPRCKSGYSKEWAEVIDG